MKDEDGKTVERTVEIDKKKSHEQGKSVNLEIEKDSDESKLSFTKVNQTGETTKEGED